jgi:DNA-binding NarL/FixJ family response regulator
MSKKILVVDDHEVMREGVRSLIAKSRRDWTVFEAPNAQEAIRLAEGSKPDVIVMDITMPGASGLEATAKIRELGMKIPILIFTMHESERLENDVREAAAQGYVLKSQAARNLILALDTLLDGGTFFGPPPQGDKLKADKSKTEKPSGGTQFFSFVFAT